MTGSWPWLMLRICSRWLTETAASSATSLTISSRFTGTASRGWRGSPTAQTGGGRRPPGSAGPCCVQPCREPVPPRAGSRSHRRSVRGAPRSQRGDCAGDGGVDAALVDLTRPVVAPQSVGDPVGQSLQLGPRVETRCTGLGQRFGRVTTDPYADRVEAFPSTVRYSSRAHRRGRAARWRRARPHAPPRPVAIARRSPRDRRLGATRGAPAPPSGSDHRARRFRLLLDPDPPHARSR